MADLSYRAERFWSRPHKGWRWTGYVIDDVGRIVASDGPHRTEIEALAGAERAALRKYAA